MLKKIEKFGHVLNISASDSLVSAEPCDTRNVWAAMTRPRPSREEGHSPGSVQLRLAATARGNIFVTSAMLASTVEWIHDV